MPSPKLTAAQERVLRRVAQAEGKSGAAFLAGPDLRAARSLSYKRMVVLFRERMCCLDNAGRAWLAARDGVGNGIW